MVRKIIREFWNKGGKEAVKYGLNKEGKGQGRGGNRGATYVCETDPYKESVV